MLNNAATLVTVEIHSRSDVGDERGVRLRGRLRMNNADVAEAALVKDLLVDGRAEEGQEGDILGVGLDGSTVFGKVWRDVLREGTSDIAGGDLGVQGLEELKLLAWADVADARAVGCRSFVGVAGS